MTQIVLASIPHIKASKEAYESMIVILKFARRYIHDVEKLKEEDALIRTYETLAEACSDSLKLLEK